MRQLAAFVVIAFAGQASFSIAATRILVVTDAEGVAGVCRQELTDPDSAELRALLTGEVNAAVRGFLAGGADEVVVWDGHDGSRTLSALTIEPSARLVHGSIGPTMLMDRGFSAVAMVGQHARADRAPAVMAHSYSSLGVQRMRLNQRDVGEIEMIAAVAGHHGIPVIFLAGDQAAQEDLLAIVPEAETVVVKEALGYYGCSSLSAPAAQALIEEGARRAMTKLGTVRPYRVPAPVVLEVEYSTRSTPSPLESLPEGVERAGARTLRFHGRDVVEAWARYLAR
jgi:D-amino peptidase